MMAALLAPVVVLLVAVLIIATAAMIISDIVTAFSNWRNRDD